MASLVTVFNTIRANQNSLFQERIPEMTAENSTEVGALVLENDGIKNDYLNALIGRIAFTTIDNRRFKNPLSILKSGVKPFGTDIEEIYINPVEGKEYDASHGATLLEQAKPDVKTIFHRLNRKNKYEVTVSDANLKKSFINDHEFTSFLEGIISKLYSGDEIDEFLLMKKLVASAISKGMVVTHEVAYDGEEQTCKDLVKAVKTFSNHFTFPSKQYNGYNKMNEEGITGETITPCTTWCPVENQVILITADVDAATDVEVLAKAFNMEKTEFLKRKIVVDTLGDDDTIAFLCDKAFFKVYDDTFKIKNFENGGTLEMKWWLHHWQTISLSLFANAVAFKKEKASA